MDNDDGPAEFKSVWVTEGKVLLLSESAMIRAPFSLVVVRLYLVSQAMDAADLRF